MNKYVERPRTSSTSSLSSSSLESLDQEQTHAKRVGKYAPAAIESVFLNMGCQIQQGLNCLEDQIGFTPWVTVVVHGYDTVEHFHRVSIEGLHSKNEEDCDVDSMWCALFARSAIRSSSSSSSSSSSANRTTRNRSREQPLPLPTNTSSMYFTGFVCEYPYCRNEDITTLGNDALVERPLFRCPKGTF